MSAGARRWYAWGGLTLAASLGAFGLGYWLATGSIRVLPEAVPPEPPPSAPEPEGAAPEPEGEESGYRIRIMEETGAAARDAAEEKPVPPTREEREGAVILRRPAGKASLAVVLDASAAAGEAVGADQLAALAEVARSAPPALTLSARTMGGDAGEDCGGSRLLLPPGGERGGLPSGWEAAGARNVSRAMYLAAGDLGNRRGKKGVAVVSTGEEECREWPCETARALLATTDRIRTWTIFLSPHPTPAEQAGRSSAAAGGDDAQTTPGEPGYATGGEFVEEPVAEPGSLPATPPAGGDDEATTAPEELVIPESLRCMASGGGGTSLVARDGRELRRALGRVVEDLSGNLTVRLYGGPGLELMGESDPRVSPWGVEVTPLAGTLPGPVSATLLPAGFGLPPGRYRVSGTWGEAAAAVEDLQVFAGEEVEVQLTLNAGRLMVFEGRRPWPPGLGGCRPGVRVEPADIPAAGGEDQPHAVSPETGSLPEAGSPSDAGLPLPIRPVFEKCGLPATFVLQPGTWKVTVSAGNAAPRSLEAVVGAGRTVVLSSSPGESVETVGVDKDQGRH